MKRILFSLLAVLVISMGIHAQEIVSVEEADMKMSQGMQPAYYVILADTNEKDAEKIWTKYMKNYKGKTKRNRKTKEYFTDNVTIKGMSNNTVDVYTKFEEMGDDTKVMVWFDLGGAYLSSNQHQDKVPAAQNLMEGYGKEMTKLRISNLLDMEEKSLKKLNGDMKSLKKDKEDYEDEIAKCEKKIEEAKKKIQQNLRDQEAKAVQITTQENVVSEVKNDLEKY